MNLDLQDVLRWPDGAWLFRYELDDRTLYLRGDFIVLEAGSDEWFEVTGL